MAKIVSVCRSEKKGTRKEDVIEGFLKKNYGLISDTHADCCTHRQVSLLAIESINKIQSQGFDVGPGDFAENLTTQGLELASLPLGTRIYMGKDVILEIAQIGKECHSGCAIYQQIGRCIMPKEGVFATVIRGGGVRAGDQITIEKMDNGTEKFSILRLTEKYISSIEDVVAREFPLTIILNNEELVTLLCSPTNLKHLTVGFLLSEGLLKSKDEIKRILIDDRTGVARVETEGEPATDVLFKRLITSGCGRGASFYSTADAQSQMKVESRTEISTQEVFNLVSEFQRRSQIYRATGGVHSAALCDTKSILVFSEDIGRHNAIDKIIGECILNDISTDDHIIITSGRISSEILLKVAKRSIPIVISKSAPTNLGVKLADDLGVTLIGFVRGKRMNVYTNNWRVNAGRKEELKCAE